MHAYDKRICLCRLCQRARSIERCKHRIMLILKRELFCLNPNDVCVGNARNFSVAFDFKNRRT
jgi:hypothetical protein